MYISYMLELSLILNPIHFSSLCAENTYKPWGHLSSKHSLGHHVLLAPTCLEKSLGSVPGLRKTCSDLFHEL